MMRSLNMRQTLEHLFKLESVSTEANSNGVDLRFELPEN